MGTAHSGFFILTMTVRTNNKFGDAFPLTFGEIANEKKGNRIFIRRFPIEPLTAEFEPSAYNVNSSGSYPRYRGRVYDKFRGYYDETEYEATVYDIYIVDGTYAEDSITLNRNDGESIDIDLSPIVGWY